MASGGDRAAQLVKVVLAARAHCQVFVRVTSGFPLSNVCLRLRDELGAIHEYGALAELFPSRGQPAEAPRRLAVVTAWLQGKP